MPTQARPRPRYAPPRERSSTTRIGSSGLETRVSITTKIAIRIRPPIRHASVVVEVQPSVAACEQP